MASAAIRQKEVTTQQLASISFGMYTDEEVRKLSVKRITSPLTYDSFNNVIPNGLYDPAMGPYDMNSRCTTCCLGHTMCPGHFGHIELPVTVYNPLVFSTLYRLLKHTCLNCHQFKMGRKEMSKFLVKFSCLTNGDLVAASLIFTAGATPKSTAVQQLAGGSSGTKGSKAAAAADAVQDFDGGVGLDGDLGTGLGAYEAAYGEGSCRRVQRLPKTCHIQEALRTATAEFFSRMPGTKCQNCGCTNPTVKKQGSTKLFKQYSRKALIANYARGIDVAAAVGVKAASSPAAAAVNGDAAAHLASKKRKRNSSDNKQQQQQQDGWGSEDDEGKSSKKGARVTAFEDKELSKGQNMKEPEEWVVEDEDSTEQLQQQQPGAGAATPAKGGKGKAAQQAAAAAELGQQLSLDDASKPKFMAPDEVEQHIQALCRNESGILHHIYGGLGPNPMSYDGLKARKGAAMLSRAVIVDPGRFFKAFFLKALAVPPNRFRPASRMGDSSFEHTQNITMQRILQTCISLQSIQQDMASQQQQPESLAAAAAAALTPAQLANIKAKRAQEALQRFMAGWLRLQNEVNALIDSTAADNTDQTGVRQQLEKKEGLFRKNMMGKRVNYAARSVISPDPYIGAGEIGVPPYFAQRLSFPEAVTPYNVEKLRLLVMNGPYKHPGALAVEDARGLVINLARCDEKKREGLAKQLQLPFHGAGIGRISRAAGSGAGVGGSTGRGKVVHRHLLDGDIMLTNRQPTLHKPGLMAHRARVLAGERTIRLHYANCATFNADFDGDEINLHLPQDQLGRAEGYGIVHADCQYIVPTDGKPIRGLIQDHVVAGVLLTSRDAFFTRAEFSQLLFNACTPWRPAGTPAVHLELPPPAVLKPRQLWTGKQLMSCVVVHFAGGRAPLSFSSSSKVPVDYWGRHSDEGSFLFRKGQLLTGCLDKAQFGKFGLVHTMQELYGDEVAGQMLNALSRLLTAFLQGAGFTCGVDDLLLEGKAEAARTKVLSAAEPSALAASAEVVRSKLITADAIAKNKKEGLAEMAQLPGSKVAGFLNAERITVAKQLEQHYCTNGAVVGAVHDRKVTGVMHPLASEVIKACIPAGQAKPFPKNCMSLMTVSGAKGSTVNFSQIACLLGQQELEGRRVPRTASGKTLPCFRAYDGGARAGGFVGDRFLTGLRPQEYYFHCMAGREGLVDTTVKTSRSGYLQRCLVKNLEALRVAHDGTVRDVCDGSVVQLYYGDDGLDVMKVSYMKQTAFLAANAASAAGQIGLLPSSSSSDGGPDCSHQQQHQDLQVQELLRKLGLFGGRQAEVAAALHRRQQLLTAADQGDEQAKAQLQQDLPLMARWFPCALGATSESFADTLERFCTNPPEHLLKTPEVTGAAAAAAEAAAALAAATAASAGGDASSEKKKKKKKDKVAGQQAELLQQLLSNKLVLAENKMAQLTPEDFRALMQLKFMSALAAPGEAVGVIAAQSVGEPSTQMTLNTFHMAGRGEANVTLGIPRLREILMTAAPRIKTPTMTMPLLPSCDDVQAQLLANRMRKLRLAECLRGIKLWERPAVPAPHLTTGGHWGKGYDLQLRFYRIDQYPKEAGLMWQQLEDAVLKAFIPQLKAAINKQMKKKGISISSMSVTAETSGRGADADGGAADDDGEGGDPAAASSRGAAKTARAQRPDEPDADDDQPDEAAEDEEADEDLREGKLRFRGGRGEAATYEEGDEEDAEVAAAIDAQMRQRLGEDDDADDALEQGGKQPALENEDMLDRDQQAAKGPQGKKGSKQQQQSAIATSAAAAIANRRRGKGAAAAAGSSQGADAGAAGGDSSKGTKSGSKQFLSYQINQQRCHIQIVVPMGAPKVLMLELAEEVAASVLVHHIPGIQAVHLLDSEKPGQPRRLQTEGINFHGIWAQQHLIDVNQIACNDVHAVLTTYGVEAARATILKEVQAVFGAYGIGVDPRHLGLIADFMTHQGGYRACNRLGIDSEISPLLKMSFETAAKFLMEAALMGGCDNLASPAARLVVGQVAEVGTGCCKVLHMVT